MSQKVTMQDIADALSLSRNTVSKALNNTGILAETTKEKVIKKAMEMGYKQFSFISDVMLNPSEESPARGGCGEIALLSVGFLGNSHFSSTMLDKFQREISMMGYSFSMHRILPEELTALRLPASFHSDRVAGIICVEMLNAKYNQMVASLGIPTLFVDSHAITPDTQIETDFLYMDNQTEIRKFVADMKKREKKRIGFVGEYMHCQSFFERYMAFRNAMYLEELPIDESFCIVHDDPGSNVNKNNSYLCYLEDQIGRLRQLPDVFICANDFVAVDLMQSFQKLNIRVPEDVYLCGFDDSPESRLITPALTTIHIHSQIMGYTAAQLLISRIKHPTMNWRIVHTETTLKYRKSTGD